MSPTPSIAKPCPVAPDRVIDAYEAVDHVTRLYKLAWSLCGSRRLAEHVTRETYLRALSRPSRLRAGRDDFPYLARTLRDVLDDHRRAEPRRTSPADLPQPRHDGDPERASHAGEVYAAVADLPECLRDVVAAVDVAGMSYAETARSLRIPLGTVMSRVYRARARLAGAHAEAA